MSHQPALAVVTCSFKKFSARRIIESIQTLILISFGANFFTSLSSLSPKPVKKEKLKLMMCCSSKFSLHLIPCFNFEPQNTQTQIFPSGLLIRILVLTTSMHYPVKWKGNDANLSAG